MAIQLLHIGILNARNIERLIERIPKNTAVVIDDILSNRLPLMPENMTLAARLIHNGSNMVYADFDHITLEDLDRYQEVTCKHNDLVIIASDVNYSVLFNKLQKKRSFFVTHI